ncbi:MAG TPA: hypothetical protein VH062_14020 [Polyangiaceae bacterium]|jgi:hypothetical protein|nr:hypothetical protein [Polyangiaceae bacterium]
MHPDRLTDLLAGRHFNMPDRIDFGMWPHPPLTMPDIVQHLSRVVADQTWFPKPFRPAEPGEPVPDLVVIERRSAEEFIVHLQASGPTGFTVAGALSRTFRSAEDAATFYLRTGMRLPGDLDGWKVVE